MNGNDINRLTGQKTGGYVNKNKLVTGKQRGWTEEGQRGEDGEKRAQKGRDKGQERQKKRK